MSIAILILILILIFHTGLENVLEEIRGWFNKFLNWRK